MSKIICEDCPLRTDCDVVPYDVKCDKKRADYFYADKVSIWLEEYAEDEVTEHGI